MTCFHPLHGWQLAGQQTESGKSVIVFSAPDRPAAEVTVPCGRCIGCRLDRSREWAMRCMHEASMHRWNSFVTLTYDEEHMPEHGALVKRDHQLFMKKLRRKYSGDKMSFFMCGEYGSQTFRPHFHFLLFGFDFPDKVVWTFRQGEPVWRSASLEALWEKGLSECSDVTWRSAAYVARYNLKKAYTSEARFERYVRDIDYETGECTLLPEEYICMSRRPAIGARWREKFRSDTYKDFLTRDGAYCKIPAYYDKLLEREEPERFARVKAARKEAASQREVSMLRLFEKEKLQEAKAKRLVRSI